MTDILPGVGAALEEQFTSHEEVAPKVSAPEPSAVTCNFCAQTFEGPARWFQRGRHEKDKHRDQWMAAKAGAKPKKSTAKKATAKAAPKPKAPTVKGPVTNARRIPAGESISRNLARVAKMVTQADPILGRALTFSAPATGSAVDEVVAGTFVDRVVIQRFAGAADKWEKFGGVIAFPILVAVISRNPAMLPMLEDDLREATLDVIVASIPTFEKKAAKEKKAVDALRRLGQIDERYANTNDPIGLILQDIFGPMVQAEESGGAA
jgi:hypothetical protein